MTLYELKKTLDSLPSERLAEELFAYHSHFGRVFKVVAIDDLETLNNQLDNRVVLVLDSTPVA